MDAKVKVKAKFKGTSRRFEIPSTIKWSDLQAQLCSLFDVGPNFLLKYRDDENESVLISSQDELDEALWVNTKMSGSLCLFIEDPSSPQTNDTTLLNLENRNQVPNQKKKKNREPSCYAALASSTAPKLSAMNAGLEKSDHTEPGVSVSGKQQQVPNQKKKKDKAPSCYTALASSTAPELSAMNARLEKLDHIEPGVAISSEQDCREPAEGAELSIQEETVSNSYVNLAEVMAQKKKGEGQASPSDFESTTCNQTRSVPSFDQEAFNQQTKNTNSEDGTFRGWFNYFEDQRQQPPPYATNKVKKSKKKKRGCYSELACAMASELANIKVVEDQKNTMESFASESDDTDISDASKNVQAGSAATFSEATSVTVKSDSKQQMNQGVQHREIKKPKRPKRHGKKKGCYAQLALDISPQFGAMNDRIKENPQLNVLLEPMDLNPQPDQDEQLISEESLSSEPFIFVNREEGLSSLSLFSNESLPPEMPISNESEEMEMTYESTISLSFEDVVPDGGQPTEQQRSSETDKEVNLTSGEENSLVHKTSENTVRETVEDQKDISLVVKDVLNSSMEFIVEQAVQRMQSMAINPPTTPCQIPQEQATSSTAIDASSKVLHQGITCDNCENEIQGVRYKCCNCQDNDLCETCESKPGIHDAGHVFLKLRFQAPGIGRRHGEMVPIFKSSVYKKTHERKLKEKQRKAAKEKEKEERKEKHVFKVQEKVRKREEKTIRKQKKEMKKCEKRQMDPREFKMSKVYRKLKMEYVCDASYFDGSVVSPGEVFLKIWVIQNVGDIAWNQWIKLECIEGSIMVAPGKREVDVPHLKPGLQGEISVEFIAPELPGTYSSKWQLSYGLHTFGPLLWCEIQVPTPSNGDDQRPLQYDQSTLVNSAFTSDTPSEPNVTAIHDTNIQAASHLIVDDGSGSEYLSSEETPETEQYRDLSVTSMSDGPPISLGTQQRQDLEWDDGCVCDVEVLEVSADDAESQNLIRFSGTEDTTRSLNDSEESDDGDYSDSSLDEITVLIPPCFDPDTPLSADPVPVRVECIKRSSSFNSKFLPRSFEPYLNIDDDDDDIGPSSLPIMASSNQGSGIETVPESRIADASFKEHCAAVPVPDVITDVNHGDHTPSGRIFPRGADIQRPIETPVSKQPSISTEDSVALVTQPSTVRHNSPPHIPPSMESNTLPSNVVSEVLSSAIDAVAMAGRAAFATVDTLFNGNQPEASAVYKPEEDCEVTVNRRPVTSSFDAPSPPTCIVTRAPGNTTMDRLIEMGFCDRRLNQQLLRKYNDDIRPTIEELLNHTENEWSSQRH